MLISRRSVTKIHGKWLTPVTTTRFLLTPTVSTGQMLNPDRWAPRRPAIGLIGLALVTLCQWPSLVGIIFGVSARRVNRSPRHDIMKQARRYMLGQPSTDGGLAHSAERQVPQGHRS
jgi:hypothetical protein